MLTNIRRAYESGVRIAGGSDAGTPYNYHENYAQEVELMWALLGMTPQQALHAATNVAAELVGLHRGILAIGEPADLLLLARDAGDDVRALREPQLVFKNGADSVAKSMRRRMRNLVLEHRRCWRWRRRRYSAESRAAPGANPTLLGQPVAGSPIRHVIVLVQENRSFDNLFASSILATRRSLSGRRHVADGDGRRQAGAA